MSVEDDVERVAKNLTALRLRQAKYIFDAMYLRAVLRQTGGDVTKAAEIAGCRRETIHRIINREKR